MTDISVIIKKKIYSQIIAILKRTLTIELIGLTFGFYNKDIIWITDFVKMKNLDNSPISFSLNYEDLYREIQNHEKKGKILVGIFHSHPEKAQVYPSDKDIRFMRNWPYPYLWLIARGGSQAIMLIYSLRGEDILKIPFTISKI